MPNWVDNRLIAHGPWDEVNQMLLRVATPRSVFGFEKIIPLPPGAAPTADLHRKIWGTKWDANSPKCDAKAESSLERLAGAFDECAETRQVEWTFSTAWSPAEPVTLELSRLFPDCTFTWDCIEEQPSFGGSMTLRAGEIVEGGYCEGSMDEIWSLSDWHEQYRYDEDEDDE